MTEEPILINDRPVDPEWGRYLDAPNEFLNEPARRRYEAYQAVRAQFPVLPEYRDGMTLEEWREAIHAANPGAIIAPPPRDRRQPYVGPPDLKPLGPAEVAEWHEACRAAAWEIRAAIAAANEDNDPVGAGKIRIPSWISVEDWQRA